MSNQTLLILFAMSVGGGFGGVLLSAVVVEHWPWLAKRFARAWHVIHTKHEELYPDEQK